MSSEQKSYSRILKSSSLIGGAQGVNMLIGMVREKIIALLIGPDGIGLVGTYRAMVQLIGTFAGLGLQSSAIRDIAEAVGSGDEERIGRTILTLRRMCWFTGSLGAVLVVLFSKKISSLTFGSQDYALEVSFVGFTILFTNVQSGQMALIQGMRRIGDLAKLNVIGVASGSVVSIGLYGWLGRNGIVPAIVLLGFIQLIVSWWFARKVKVPLVAMSWIDSFRAAGGMVRLGIAFMWSGLLVSGVAYATRILIAQKIDLTAVGIFTAAYALSGMFVNFVLNAMGADYYPSLTAVNHDHAKMRDLVNQQTEIGLLLALPGLLGTLAFAPWAIKIFYSAEFIHAADLLRWFVVGCLGRVISFPMTFVILAKGSGRLYALTETIANVLHAGLIWGLLSLVGLSGVSVAFCVLYVFHIFMMLVVSRCLIGFFWSKRVVKLLGIFLPVVPFTFVVGYFLSDAYAIMIGVGVVALSSVFSLGQLSQRLGDEHNVSRIIKRVFGRVLGV